MNEPYNSINLYYNGVDQLNQNVIGIKGSLINYVSHISVNGCDFCILVEDDVIWVNLSTENTLLEIFYPTDINEDGVWDILDILLTINFIMGTIEPTTVQSFSADLNEDGLIDILDIIMMVNFILLSN